MLSRVVKPLLASAYVLALALTGSKVVGSLTESITEQITRPELHADGVALTLSLAEIIAFFTFCTLVLPSVWYMRGLSAKIEKLEEKATENRAAIELNFDRLETQISAHGIENCPVAKDYLARRRVEP
jgi:hypothetical protein